ncbi:MAG TPA: hypothetical protein VEV13_00260 [Candidatus Limnocylindria bacterium]|nr:hypothetical protein [Candidatus Limnocylindria bacterium]
MLVTLRPLTHIMPSAWQQYVRNGQVTTYDAWLKGMLKRPPYDKPTPSFWRRHRHDRLVERWASVVGPVNLTVLVVDENDRDLLTHSVEAMLGLPLGILQPEPGRSNRSLTWGEIELVRQLNLEFRARDWPEGLYRATVFPMVKNLQESHRPGPDERPITTPGWALDRAAEIGAAAAEVIAASGVRVVGDLSVLGSRPPDQREPGVAVPPQLPSVAAKDAMVGMIARWDRLPLASGMAVADRMRELVRSARSSNTVGRLERRVRPFAGGIER